MSTSYTFRGTQKIGSSRTLEIGGCDTIALTAQYGTPLITIDELALRRRCSDYLTSFRRLWPHTSVAYAAKAFMARRIIEIVVEEGLDLEVASGGELLHALSCGVPPERIALHGHYKLPGDIRIAVDHNLGCIVIDAPEEVAAIADTVRRAGGRRQAVMLRVNPAAAVSTNTKYLTGAADSKFGLPLDDGTARDCLLDALGRAELDVLGIHFHLGSQLTSAAPYLDAFTRVGRWLRSVDHGTDWKPRRIVVGGGMGVQYTAADPAVPAPLEWATELVKGFRQYLLPLCLTETVFGIEPGRSLMAETGTTLYTVGPVRTVKVSEHGTRTYVNLDGGLSDNPRPLMYGATHDVVNASRPGDAHTTSLCLMGRHCETDLLFPEALLPETQSGDVLAVLCTGAYTYVQSSNYNRFPRPAVVMVRGGQSELILRRETPADLAATEVCHHLQSSPPMPDDTRSVPHGDFRIWIGHSASVPSLEATWHEYYEHITTIGHRIGRRRPPEEAWQLTRTGYAAELETGSGLLVIASDPEDDVVAYAFGRETAKFTLWYGYERVIELDDFVVRRHARGARMSKVLLDMFLQEADRRGYGACRALVLDDDPQILSFWQNHGYEPVMHLVTRSLEASNLPHRGGL
jgi:diaminopimelate decarboxylase